MQKIKLIYETSFWGWQGDSVVKEISAEDDSLILGIHMVEGENQLPQVVLWPPAMSHPNKCNIKL